MTQPHALNPSALRERARAHRSMALAALRSDSSLAVRLARYNQHMTTARSLEAEAQRQQATRTDNPRTALAWLQSGRPLRIAAPTLRDHLNHAQALAALEAQGVAHA